MVIVLFLSMAGPASAQQEQNTEYDSVALINAGFEMIGSFYACLQHVNLCDPAYDPEAYLRRFTTDARIRVSSLVTHQEKALLPAWYLRRLTRLRCEDDRYKRISYYYTILKAIRIIHDHGVVVVFPVRQLFKGIGSGGFPGYSDLTIKEFDIRYTYSGIILVPKIQDVFIERTTTTDQ